MDISTTDITVTIVWPHYRREQRQHVATGKIYEKTDTALDVQEGALA